MSLGDVLSFLLFRVLLASSFFFFFNPQHPCVHDEVTGLSLLGLPALQALLYHCRYFQHVALCASSCYQGRRVFHAQPCADAGGGGLFPPENTLLGRSGVKPITRCQQGSPSEISSVRRRLDSEDSLLFWRSVPPASADNHRRPSSSLSTSSTMVSGPLTYTHSTLQNQTMSTQASPSFWSFQSRGSMLHTPKGPSPLNVTEDTPASRLMTQGTREAFLMAVFTFAFSLMEI